MIGKINKDNIVDDDSVAIFEDNSQENKSGIRRFESGIKSFAISTYTTLLQIFTFISMPFQFSFSLIQSFMRWFATFFTSKEVKTAVMTSDKLSEPDQYDELKIQQELRNENQLLQQKQYNAFSDSEEEHSSEKESINASKSSYGTSKSRNIRHKRNGH